MRRGISLPKHAAEPGASAVMGMQGVHKRDGGFMSTKKQRDNHPKTAWVKIEYDPRDGDYLATSSINPQVKVFASTRHRALSAIERDMPCYLRWEKEMDAKYRTREKEVS